MSITTTATIPWTVDNTSGTTAFKVRHRLSGTTVWSSSTVPSNVDELAISALLINRLYDFQVVNINGDANPASAVVQSINITDPYPQFYPTNVAISLEFDNLSEDIDSYTATIAEVSTPGNILHTEVISPADSMEYTFVDLTPSTDYLITLTPVANQFYTTFSYTETTTAFSSCPAPNTVTATLT